MEKIEAAGNAYKFQNSWLESSDFVGWLQKKEHNGSVTAYCKLCNQFIAPHKATLMRHKSASKHVSMSKAIQKTTPIEKCITSGYNMNVERAEMKIVSALAVYDLPISLVDDLIPILKDSFPDSEIAKQIMLHRTKATGVLKNKLAKSFSELLIEKLRNGFFSIIVDEVTDISNTKQLGLVVTYYDEESNAIKTSFLELKECTSGTAKHIYEAMRNTLSEHCIPFENVAGFSADTCNVMFGGSNSVAVLLKKDNPFIVNIKCSCHLIHLVASKSSKKLPTYIEDFLSGIGTHFSRSYARQKALVEFQEYFTTEAHKILVPCRTRWLSTKSCVDRVLEQYEPLTHYLRLEVFENPSKTTESLLEAINMKETKIYLYFMSYALELLTDFNIFFQSEKPLLHKVKESVYKLLQTILSNYMDITVVKRSNVWEIDFKNQDHFVEVNNIYIGVLAQEPLLELSVDERVSLLTKCREFYCEAVHLIRKKFDFSDEIFDILEILNPSVAQSLQIKSLQKFLKRFPSFPVKLKELDKEWREHALLDYKSLGIDNEQDSEVYWTKIFGLKDALGSELFPNLKKVIKFLLIMPFSNASVERIFSALNNCKTNKRNKLKSDTLSALFIVKEGLKGKEINFEPTTDMFKRTWK